MPDPQVLGALYAITAVLAILSTILIAIGLSVWSWLRGHERGEVRWTRTGAELKVESPGQVRSGARQEMQS